MRGSRGVRQGVRAHPPLKKRFLINTGPDPLKNHMPSQRSMFGHHWHDSEWRFAGGPMMARFIGIWITSSTKII